MIGDKYNMDNWNWELGNYKPKLYLMISFNVHFIEHWGSILLQNQMD